MGIKGMKNKCVAVFLRKDDSHQGGDFRAFTTIQDVLEEYATCLSAKDIEIFEVALKGSQVDAVGLFQTPDRPGVTIQFIVGHSIHEVQDHLRMVVYHQRRHPQGPYAGIVPAPDLT